MTYTAVYLVGHEAGNKKVKTETPVRVPSRCKVLETLILIFCKILKTFKNLIVWVVLNFGKSNLLSRTTSCPTWIYENYEKQVKKFMCGDQVYDQVENDFDLLYQ